MSVIRPNAMKLEINKEVFYLQFNVNIIEQIQDYYDIVFTEFLTKLNDEKEVFSAVKFLLTTMINDYIDDYNETHNDKKEYKTQNQIGRALTIEAVYDISLQLVTMINETMPKVESDTPRED